MSAYKCTTWVLDLGSTDCETCGGNTEDLTVEYHHYNGQVEVTLRVGCYGGRHLSTHDMDEAVAFLSKIGDDYLAGDLGYMASLVELIADLKAMRERKDT